MKKTEDFTQFNPFLAIFCPFLVTKVIVQRGKSQKILEGFTGKNSKKTWKKVRSSFWFRLKINSWRPWENISHTSMMALFSDWEQVFWAHVFFCLVGPLVHPSSYKFFKHAFFILFSWSIGSSIQLWSIIFLVVLSETESLFPALPRTLTQTSIKKSQYSLVKKIVCFSSKNGWEGFSCMISSNINKNIRLLYILFPSSSLIPQPLPLCSSKLLQTWPTSLSKRNSCFPPISFFFPPFLP